MVDLLGHFDPSAEPRLSFVILSHIDTYPRSKNILEQVINMKDEQQTARR